jgi:hypothetical protein
MKKKQRRYKGMDKKPITDMSVSKRAKLDLWAKYNAKQTFKPRKPKQSTIKILVGMEYKK